MAEQLASVEQLSGVFSALARGHVLEADRMLLDMRALKAEEAAEHVGTATPPQRKLLRLAALHAWGQSLDMTTKYVMPVEKAYNSLSYLRRGGPDALKAKFEQLQDKLAHPPPGARQLEGMEELWTSGAGASSSNGNGSGGGAGGILGGAGGDGSDGWGGGGGGGGGALLEDIGFRLQLLSKELNHNKQLKRSLGVLTECMVAEIAAVSFLLLGQSSMLALFVFESIPAAQLFRAKLNGRYTMVCLSSAKLQMERWRQIVTGMIGSGGGTGRESSEVLFAPANTLSKIYSALAGAYSRLAAKSSIYFYQPLQPSLSNVSSAPGSAQRLARVTDLSSFQRKVGACMVSVHRSAANHARTGCLRLDGYCHPAAPAEPLAGLKSFPALISIPFDEGVPMNHMVTIYSLAADEIDRLAANDVVVFDESEFRATRRAPEKFAYYLARVDTLATLVVVFHLKGKKGVDKEQNTTTREFIIEFRKNMGKIWQSGI
eukprot:gene1341-22983_t